MKFARICFLENAHKNPFLDKAPELLRRAYYTRVYKNKFSSIRLFSAEGLLAGLPFDKNEKNFELLNKYVEKTVIQLKDMGVYSVCAEKGIPLPYGIRRAEGKCLLCAMGETILKNACNAGEIIAEEADIAVIDGGDDSTKILLSSIASAASKLYVYTLRPDELKTVFEEIFERTGLCIVAFSALNGEFMRKAGIIINLNKGGDVYSCFSKNAIYIDLAEDIKNTGRIAGIRRDMKALGGFEISRGKRTIPPDYAEAAVSVINRPFGEMIFNGFSFKKFDKSQKLMSQYGFDVISSYKLPVGQVKS